MYIGYVTLNSVKPFKVIVNNANAYIKECNGNKYLVLVPADESKNKLKKYEEIWSKIKDLNGSANNNSDHYDKNI